MRPLHFLIAIFLAMNCVFVSAQSDIAEVQVDEKTVKQNWESQEWNFGDEWRPVVSKEKAEAYGRRLEEWLKAGDVSNHRDFLDIGPLAVFAANGITHKGFIAGFNTGVRNSPKQLYEQFSREGASYTFLGVKSTKWGAAPAFRMINPNSATNYQFWFLIERQDKIVAVDMFGIATGERLSETMRRMALISAPEETNLINRLIGRDKLISENKKKFLDMLIASKDQNDETIIKSYHALPDKLKAEKSVMLMRITAAGRSDQKEYVVAIKDFVEKFPDDASATFASVDLLLANGKFDEMHEALEKTSKSVGLPDSHLHVLHATAFVMEKKYEDALNSSKKAAKIQPDYHLPYFSGAAANAGRGEFDKTVAFLKLLTKDFGYVEFDLSIDPAYREFLKSKEHAEWRKWLAEQK